MIIRWQLSKHGDKPQSGLFLAARCILPLYGCENLPSLFHFKWGSMIIDLIPIQLQCTMLHETMNKGYTCFSMQPLTNTDETFHVHHHRWYVFP